MRPVRQIPAREMLQATDQLRTIRPDQPLPSGCGQFPVETRRRPQIDFRHPLTGQVQIDAWTQRPGHDLLRVLPDSRRDQPGRDEQLLPVRSAAADEDVGVRVVRVVMVDCQPFQPGPKLGLEARHGLADEGFEIAKRLPVLGADDHPKVTGIVGPASCDSAWIDAKFRAVVEPEFRLAGDVGARQVVNRTVHL